VRLNCPVVTLLLLSTPSIPHKTPSMDFANAPEDDLALESAIPRPNDAGGWSLIPTTHPPSPRSLHAAACHNGVLYLFGGYDGHERVHTFFAYTFATQRWTPVLAAGVAPSPRDRHIAVCYGNAFYVQGGFDGRSRVSDVSSSTTERIWESPLLLITNISVQMHEFDFTTMAWRQVHQDRPPTARHSHSCVIHNDSLYICFGYDGSYKNDVHEYSFATHRWNAVSTVGRRPRARYRATTVLYQDDMIVYGGHDGVRHLNDVHALNVVTQTWTMLDMAGPAPVPRDSHVSVLYQDSMYVFAGSSGAAMNDFYELHLPSATWKAVTSAHPPRHRFCHVGVVHDGSFYCFGGYDGRDRLNDFVRYDFGIDNFQVPEGTLVDDLRSWRHDVDSCDVTFVLDDGSHMSAHRLILRKRCAYFQAMFGHNMRESRLDEIPLRGVERHVLDALLEYLYTDTLMTDDNDIASIMQVFGAADLFGLHRLKIICCQCLLQSITPENCATLFLAADVHAATDLRAKTKAYLLQHFEQASKTTAFEEMGRTNMDLVFEILKSR